MIKCVTEKVKVVCNSLAYAKYQHCTEALCNNAKLVRVPGYRSKGPGSILGATRFFEK
jgi:hypothetical protein